MSQTNNGEQTDFQSQIKYHQILSSLKIETEPDLSMQNVLDNENGYRSPSTDSPREPTYGSWDDSAEDSEDSKFDDLLILLDWDDTLFPTTYITEVLQNSKNGIAMVNDAEMACLSQLGQATLNLLQNLISKYGAENIYIVTNSLSGWIKDSLHYASCISNVYRQIERLLNEHSIPMHSAQSLYAKKDEKSSTPTAWKTLCFSDIINNNSHQSEYTHIVSIGDQWTDHYAAKQSIQSLIKYSPIHHIIKLKTKATVNDMMNEMLYVQTCFNQIFDVISNSIKQGTTSSSTPIQPVIVDYYSEELKYYQSLNVNKSTSVE